MARMVFRLERRVKVRVRRLRRQTRDKGLAMRCQIVLLADRQRRREAIAESVGCSLSWVKRVIARFGEHGIAGLLDRREDNGQVKLDERFLATLYGAVDGTPQDYGFHRPTWTLELLVIAMKQLTGVKVHPGTLSRALKMIGARRGRPKPTVGCPWSLPAKNRRLAKIRRVVDSLAKDQVAVFLDEVDIHLNPKIGCDWMNRGKQKEVMTPGQNVKRYLCGALDSRSGEMTWVAGEKKNSLLFIDALRTLVKTHSNAKVIHVILDNFRIHHSKAAREAVESFEGRVVLHFLPPYCPDDNRIERVWLDLHANVTRNHRCRSIEELMKEAIRWLKTRNRVTARQAA